MTPLPHPTSDRAALLASRHEIRRARGVLERMLSRYPTVAGLVVRLTAMVAELEEELVVCEAEEVLCCE